MSQGSRALEAQPGEGPSTLDHLPRSTLLGFIERALSGLNYSDSPLLLGSRALPGIRLVRRPPLLLSPYRLRQQSDTQPAAPFRTSTGLYYLSAFTLC